MLICHPEDPLADRAVVRLTAGYGPQRLFASRELPGPTTSRRPSPRVLIVEDDYLVSGSMEAELAGAGFDVVGIATSAKEAVDLAIGKRPHIIIMDIKLDGPRDGIDAALEIFDRQGIRSLFASAHHDVDTQGRAQPCQPLGWIAKPYSMNLLVTAARAAMREIGGPEPQTR